MRLRVLPGFILVALLAGALRGPVGSIATVVLLVSVLLAHELPRAALGRAFGRSCELKLSISGGETVLDGAPLRGAARIAFTFIGSASNLIIAALAVVLARGGSAELMRGVAAAHGLWGYVQVLPLAPFRAGVLVEDALSPRARFAHAMGSLVLLVPVALGLLQVSTRPVFVAMAVLVFAETARRLRDTYRESRDALGGIEGMIAQAKAALSNGAPAIARELAERGLRTVCSPTLREKLARLLTWSGIGLHDPFLAHAALMTLDPGKVDLHLLAAYLSVCNRSEEAIALLTQARAQGHRQKETTLLLADLLYRRGDAAAVRVLVEHDEALLSATEKAAVEDALAGSE